MSKGLKVERMIELEIWLVENYPSKANKIGALDYFYEYFQGDDLLYLMDAFEMPFYEVKRAIIRYDSSHPKMDELRFLADLQKRFCKIPFDLIRRIRQVRKMMLYLSKNTWVKIPNIEEEPLIDNDDWSNLLKQDKENSENIEKALNYEERKRALVEKCKILRFMAEFNGMSLDDLIKEGDKSLEGNYKLKKDM